MDFSTFSAQNVEGALIRINRVVLNNVKIIFWLPVFNERIKHSFLCFKVCNPECDNALQPEPQSGEGRNALLYEGLCKC